MRVLRVAMVLSYKFENWEPREYSLRFLECKSVAC